MKIQVVLFMVMTINGAVARSNNEDVKVWTSKEDRNFLIEALEKYDAIITGRRSFFGKIVNKPYYILTHDTHLNSSDVNLISGTPDYIIKQMEKMGHKKIALLGGLNCIEQFLKENFIDEMFITVEPKMMGAARPFLLEENIEAQFEMVSYKILNKFGTIVLHYKFRSEEEHIVVQNAPNLSSDKLMSINKDFWNERASLHANSEFYQIDKIINNCKKLQKFEIDELGNVKNKKIAHLQCHIGAESIMLARLGAEVIGLDYSSEAIRVARIIAEKAKVNVCYVCSDVYLANQILENESFDMVFVNFGALTMLPDLDRWGKVIKRLLKEKGEIYISEIHPVAASLAYDQPLFTADYFDRNPKIWNENGSYADGVEERNTKKTLHNDLVVWNWTLGDIVTSVAQNGFLIEFLHERNCHVDKRYLYLEKKEDGLWYTPTGIPSVPGTFTLKARKVK